MIGQLSNPPTVAELANAHGRVHLFASALDYPISNNEMLAWCENTTKVLDATVTKVANNITQANNPQKAANNIIMPLRKLVQSQSQESY